MTTKHIFTAAILLLPMGVTAQNPLNGESEYRYDEATQLWRNTENAAGFTIDSARNRGYAEFNLMHRSGNYHRVQEGNQTNELDFFTERYQHVGKYLYGYGRFKFDYGRTKERAWSDVMRTYNSNPFITGSSVFGKYDFQNFDLTARLGTVDFSGWRFGLSLDYKVGDLSRLRDPRSRSRLLDYKLTPSANYTIGKHTIGLAGWYHRYKEKIPGLTTVQTNPNLYYYQMTGLEAVSGTIGGYSGYSREYVNHAFGMELQYGYQADGFRSVNAVSIERGAESMLEQYKREPGKYYTYTYKFATQNRIITSSVIHEIDFSAQYRQAYADEFRPTLVITIDSTTGNSSRNYYNQFTYKKRYQQKLFNMELKYRVNFTDGDAVKSYVGAWGVLSAVSQKHLLPTSKFNLNDVDFGVEYGQALLANRRLWLTLNAGCHINNNTDLRLGDNTTAYAQNVLIPDLDYYNADYWTGGLSLMYQFPMTVKRYRSLWYVKGYAQTIQAQQSLSRNIFGISVGIFN